MNQEDQRKLILQIHEIQLDIAAKELDLTGLYMELNTLKKIAAQKIKQEKVEKPITDTDMEIFYQLNNLLRKRSWINQKVEKKEVYKTFSNLLPEYSLTPNGFTKKLKEFCKYSGYIFNPKDLQNTDGRIKSNGVEYFYIKIPK